MVPEKGNEKAYVPKNYCIQLWKSIVRLEQHDHAGLALVLFLSQLLVVVNLFQPRLLLQRALLHHVVTPNNLDGCVRLARELARDVLALRDGSEHALPRDRVRHLVLVLRPWQHLLDPV